MSLPQLSSQTDHFVSPNKLVTSNTYDWLRYRDQIERTDRERSGEHSPEGDNLSLHWYAPASGTSLVSTNTFNRLAKVFTNSEDQERVGLLSDPTFQDKRYDIQYSVFKPLNGYTRSKEALKDSQMYREKSRRHFQSVVSECIDAITNHHIELSRIKAGSSGSYFVYGTSDPYTPMGVFKPKEEEPYGPLSPKWTKWAHRTFFPCFFGRSCLIPNLGYICESAANLLDQRLETHLVPYTDTVVLESTKFYDQRQTWLFLCHVEPRKQKKLGSFQLFLNDYVGADVFFEKYPLPGMYRDGFPGNTSKDKAKGHNTKENGTNTEERFEWTETNLVKFRLELEKLIILDYIMRNTDRGLDNWMVKIKLKTTTSGETEWDIRLAAIDNGLAFPWKHPDEWRSYPYGWLYLPLNLLAQPFSEVTRRHFLPILTSPEWWQESYKEFTNLFSRDADFKIRMWKKQWAVLKGQAFNVVETLKDIRQGPLELVRRSRCRVLDEKMTVPTVYPILRHTINDSIPNLASSPMILNSLSGHKTLAIDDATGDYPIETTVTNNSSSLDDNSENRPGYKLVIIERLQVVNSIPVFTWC